MGSHLKCETWPKVNSLPISEGWAIWPSGHLCLLWGDSRHYKNTYRNQIRSRVSHSPISCKVPAENNTLKPGDLRMEFVKEIFIKVWAECTETTRDSNSTLKLMMGARWQHTWAKEAMQQVVIQTSSQRSTLTGPVTFGQETQLCHSDPSGGGYKE